MSIPHGTAFQQVNRLFLHERREGEALRNQNLAKDSLNCGQKADLPKMPSTYRHPPWFLAKSHEYGSMGGVHASGSVDRRESNLKSRRHCRDAALPSIPNYLLRIIILPARVIRIFRSPRVSCELHNSQNVCNHLTYLSQMYLNGYRSGSLFR